MWKYAVFVFLIFELLILFGTLEEIPNQYCFLWFLFFLDLQARAKDVLPEQKITYYCVWDFVSCAYYFLLWSKTVKKENKKCQLIKLT